VPLPRKFRNFITGNGTFWCIINFGIYIYSPLYDGVEGVVCGPENFGIFFLEMLHFGAFYAFFLAKFKSVTVNSK